MDQPGLDERDHARALRGLDRVNWISRSGGILWRAMARFLPTDGRPLRILDLACGGGSVTVGLAKQAVRSGLPVEIAGCDVSPTAVEIARHRAADAGWVAGAGASSRSPGSRPPGLPFGPAPATQPGLPFGPAPATQPVEFFVCDVLRDPLPHDYDVLCCSLFLHHLDESQAVMLLRRMAESARRLVLVDDLVRGRLGYFLARVGTHLLSRSPIVHYDGPVSVAAAFTPEEMLDLAEQAGLHGASLTRHWPQRFLFSWERRP